MPFTIKENSKGEYCVYKKNDDGEAVGRSFGCHAVKDDAEAQIGAIESEMKRRGKKSIEFNFYVNSGGSISDDSLTSSITTTNAKEWTYVDARDWNMDDEDTKAFERNVGGGVDREKLKDSDFVFPDERTFPIVIAKDVEDAVNSWGRYKGKKSFETFKKKLTALAKRKGFESSLPKEWVGNKKEEKSLDSELDIKATHGDETSLDDRRRMVSDAWRATMKGRDDNWWVREVFGSFVIVDNWKEGGCYKVGYSENETGDVVFEDSKDWKEVKLRKEWIEKFFDLGISDLIDTEQPPVDNRYAIKSLGENRIGAYGILWGDEKNKDLHGEYFTKSTKDVTAIFDVIKKVPFIVHHGKDDEVKEFVAGEVDVMEVDDTGLWYEAKIKEHEAYRKYVKPFLKDKKMFSSSGTLPAARRVNKDTGEITRWPIAEMTGTWIPAEYRMLDRPIGTIKSAYQELGLEVDLENYEEEPVQKPNVKGVEKARLQTLIDQELLRIKEIELSL